jgi:hypothetical protein
MVDFLVNFRRVAGILEPTRPERSRQQLAGGKTQRTQL